jgi:hypothetical protein
MADSIISQITENLLGSVAGKFLIRDENNAITVEEARIDDDPENRYPFVRLSSPQVTVTNRANKRATCEIRYTMYLVDNRINDSGKSNPPLDRVIKNDAADLCKMIMADNQRGGLAARTHWDGYGPYAVYDPVEVGIYVNVMIIANVNEFDPYQRG